MANLIGIKDWDKRFEEEIKSCLSQRADNFAGRLLQAIPGRTDWEDFCTTVRSEWPEWSKKLWLAPACLIILYCGLGFFEYDDGRFWSEFFRVVGIQPFPANKQSSINSINQDFECCAKHLKIPLRHHANSRDYVGSAIYLAGIPISVWGDFLFVCQWALWHEEWENLSEDAWKELVKKRCGGHQRLKMFLIDNRELAKKFIKEMITLRRRISEQPESVLDDKLIGNGLIRREYFEEAPETAEFLSPKNPERLNRDRISLAFDKQRAEIYLRVPAVDQTKLPAKWKIGEITQVADGNPGKITLNPTALQPRIRVEFISSSGEFDRRLLTGIESWGIFDLDDNGTMVNPKRTQLPTRRYALLSRTPLDGIERKGFSTEDCPSNDPFELFDGTRCYLTMLDPNDERASVDFRKGENENVSIKFRPRERIECHFLPAHAQGQNLACFRREGDVFITPFFPTLCLSVPPNFFGGSDTTEQISKKFEVRIVDRRTQGKWKQFCINGSKLEYFRWEWSDPDHPVMEKRQSGIMVDNFRDFKSLYDIPEWQGDVKISVKSPEFNQIWKINKKQRQDGIERLWNELPGDFLPMILLSQSERMNWEEIILARNAVRPGCRIEKNTLYRYQEFDLLKQSGANWRIAQSRAVIKIMEGIIDTVELDYCGDSGILWGLYCNFKPDDVCLLPKVKVAAETAESPAYLQMVWPLRLRKDIESFLIDHDVEIKESLWIR